jgi:3-deoxy-D-manno-octulosonic-acid transferase
MILLYNIIQIIALLLGWPLLLFIALITPKYRTRIPARFGFGIRKLADDLPENRPRIWFHALSVGEVSSAKPLVDATRKCFPNAVLIFSTTTLTGQQFAKQILTEEVTAFVPFPFDLYPTSSSFIDHLSPDLFVQIETDFWPNFLTLLQRRGIPRLLANGRISQKSFKRYKKLSFLFTPVFSSFNLLAMQTREDEEIIQELGVSPAKTRSFGNLKYDAALPDKVDNLVKPEEKDNLFREFNLPAEKKIFIAGSTHSGEEKIVLSAFKRLSATIPTLFIIIAPRNPERGPEIIDLAQEMGISLGLRSNPKDTITPSIFSGLILDTLGELHKLYQVSDVSFVGGSFIAKGGHNPLEPASMGKPVLFGPFMDDFTEAAGELVKAGGGSVCRNEEDLFDQLQALLMDDEKRQRQGNLAFSIVQKHKGAALRHLQCMQELLEQTRHNRH